MIKCQHVICWSCDDPKELALRNIMRFALEIKNGKYSNEEIYEHLLRFCKQGGVEPNILRDNENKQNEQEPEDKGKDAVRIATKIAETELEGLHRVALRMSEDD